ncbi:MAG TPA: alpha/beta hydrolase-fold protein [bacterium]|nr:alpha/beta hydrolase-fold protein [bacterium]
MVRFRLWWVAVAVGLVCGVSAGFAANESALAAKFLKRSHTFKTTLPYRLFVPEKYDASKTYPLILALHGAGERGRDNELPLKANALGLAWADSAVQAKNPCFIVLPQCPADRQWVNTDWSKGSYSLAAVGISDELQTVSNLLDSLTREFAINTDRLYVVGLSMGGYGTWDLIARFPNRFAAAVPICGGADTSHASSLRSMPLWIFHGSEDAAVPVAASREMVEALIHSDRACVFPEFNYRTGGNARMADSVLTDKVNLNAPLLYTEYAGKGHAVWPQALALPQLPKWLLAQKRTVEVSQAKVPQIDIMEIAFNYPNPFNPSTTIEYSLKKSTLVAIDILNLAGQKIVQLASGRQEAGRHFVRFDAKDLPSGNYFFRIITPDWVQHGNMILLK